MRSPISLDQLVEDAKAQRAADACVALLVAGAPTGTESPFRLFAELELPGSLPRWLSHLRATAPALYEHSIRVALVAAVLGAVNRVAWHDRQWLLMAGLFHDLGHLKLGALNANTWAQLDTVGLYQLRSHPVVSHLILSNIDGVPAAMARAVLEHHERLDGSGYPAGLREHQLSLAGQLLALAEAVVGIIDKGAAAQLPVKLCLEPGKFHLDSVAWVATLFAEHGPRPEAVDIDPAVFAGQLRELDEWLTSLAALQLPGDDGWLTTQVAALRRGLLAAGLDPAAPDALIEVAGEDGALRDDVAVVFAEALVQSKFIIREAAGRIALAAGGLAEVVTHPEWERLELLRRQVVAAMPAADKASGHADGGLRQSAAGPGDADEDAGMPDSEVEKTPGVEAPRD